MIKRIILISLVAVIAYYAGIQGITPGNITDWFEGNKITETLKSTLSKTLELAEEKQVAEKAGNLIDDLKEKYLNDENHAEFSQQMTFDKISSDVSNWTIDYDHDADKRSLSKNKKVKLKKIDNTYLPDYINENKSIFTSQNYQKHTISSICAN